MKFLLLIKVQRRRSGFARPEKYVNCIFIKRIKLLVGITRLEMGSWVDMCLSLQIAWSNLERTEDLWGLKEMRFWSCSYSGPSQHHRGDLASPCSLVCLQKHVWIRQWEGNSDTVAGLSFAGGSRPLSSEQLLYRAGKQNTSWCHYSPFTSVSPEKTPTTELTLLNRFQLELIWC